ncbi:MFS transporter [Nocardia sp. NBC_01730]|uniref:MFS transporter n=1 Tax=Nocardia sp. NBC_01730 TaxID=2975998 RepID=UPI002E133859|nr:MFS transporter [Nocardia sp. NBC_01730]
MTELFATYRGFNRPSRLLMVNQFAINTGFYMLMPYLAGHLAGPLGLAAWAIGLVLGVRNFAQQGMFLLGGTLADRLGYKPLIVAGCLLRTGGFALLAFADSLPALLVASAATGFAGALFNPAVRAYLAVDSATRRVEAFAVFNVFYQAGILFGPIVGLALMAFDFRATAAGAATVFGLLTLAQLRALPQHSAEPKTASVLDDWRVVLANRPFLLFAAAMTGSSVLAFQVYLALPMQATRIVGASSATALMTSIFVVSGVIAIAGQLRITRWFGQRLGRTRSLALGMAVLAAGFVPLLLVPGTAFGVWPAVGALLLTAAVLGVGTAAVFPFEMDTVVALSGNQLVATHYGLYHTIVGIGVLLGNLGIGALLDAARGAGMSSLAWAALIAVGATAAAALFALARAGRLDAPVPIG